MSLNMLHINSKLKNYKAVMDNISSKHIEDRLQENSFFIIDENVWKLYNVKFFTSLNSDNSYILTVNENEKKLETVMAILDELIKKSVKKNLKIIAVGGGITQDIAGHLASILYRGVKWDFWATTLLAQADSCIGGKTSLNYKNYKNLIGTFYPPDEIIIDVNFNQTLKDYDYLSGVGEIAKLHIIGGRENADLFINMIQGLLSRDRNTLDKAIFNSLVIKKEYIEDDEFDSGRRNYLNYGHCFGHAIESATDFAIPHGLSVIQGMILANFVSKNRGLLSSDNFRYLNNKICLPIISDLNLNKHKFTNTSIIEGMKQDKKRTGEGLPLVMIDDKLQMRKVDDLSEKEVTEALEYIKNELE